MNKKLLIAISIAEFLIIIFGSIYLTKINKAFKATRLSDNQINNSQEAKEYLSADSTDNFDQKMYQKNKEIFPKNIDGYQRYLIDLPQKSNEDNYEVEILAGITNEFDCNRQFISGSYEKKTIEGYGYDYYLFNSNGVIGSTQMACIDDTKTEKFVSQSLKVRYNSNLPVVIFAPKGFDVKYNLWTARESNIKAISQ